MQGGRSVMRSTETWEKGFVEAEGIGERGGEDGCVFAFIS